MMQDGGESSRAVRCVMFFGQQIRENTDETVESYANRLLPC